MELASSSFRRQFLFQVLFYLQSIENDDKVLSKRILGLLDNCGSKYLTEALEDVIRHENNWIRWKKSGCKSYELPPISTQAKPMVQPTTRAGDAKNYGTEALSALFANSPKPTKRKRLDDLIVELDYQYNDDMSFAEGVEQEFLPTNDPKYNWQLYRLCVAEHLEYLEGDLDPTALLAAWRKHRKSSV